VRHLFGALESATPLPAAALAQRLGWADTRITVALDAALALGVCRGAADGFVRLPLA
jgi:hypothetical protein